MLSLTAAVLLVLSSQSGVDRLTLSSAEIPDQAASPAQDKPGQKIEAPRPSAPEKSLIDVWFEDGLRFKSRDGNFEGRIGGRFLTHYRQVFDRPFETQGTANLPVRTLPNGFFVRQARLETEGTLYQDWGYKVQVDFGTSIRNQSSGANPSNVSGTLRDGFVEWKRFKFFQVRLGQFFEPISQEDISSTRFIDFAERSPMNRLLPGREIGLQIAGSLLDNGLTYAVMLCNGNAMLNDQGRAVNDGNDQKEVAGLIRVSPFVNSGEEWLKGLRIGLAGSWGLADVSTADFDLVSTELSILWADSNVLQFEGFRGRIVPQLSWPIGPFGVRAEYLYRTDELLNGLAGGPGAVRTKGWYAYATWILTGENKKYEDRIVPAGEWGAVELAFRVSQVSLDNAFSTGLLTTPGNNSDAITAYTFGVNWWITRNVRVTFNLIREKYRDPVAFETRSESMLMGFLFRGQIDF